MNKKNMLTSVAAALLLMASSSIAGATTLTFGTYDGTAGDTGNGTFGYGDYQSLGTTYTEQGYQFINTAELDRWMDGIPADADPTSSTGLFTNYGYSSTTMTKIGGGAFTLNSIDVADIFNNGDGGSYLNYSYTLSDNSTGTGKFKVDVFKGYQTLVLNLANLTSFSFTPDIHLEWVQFDNVHVGDVAAVPLPAALPLFGAAIAGMSMVGRQRRKAEAMTA